MITFRGKRDTEYKTFELNVFISDVSTAVQFSEHVHGNDLDDMLKQLLLIVQDLEDFRNDLSKP